MHSFIELLKLFEEKFNSRQFPDQPATLYDPAQYILGIGGKRIRPVCVLMGNQLFDEIGVDAYHAASAIELFHNFSLIHDDIMDKAPVRRGMATVHTKYGESTAILAGDVMFVKAYENLNKIQPASLQKVLHLFNITASQVCEGQQLDMDFEQREMVSFDEYLEMITLKTSVLVAASLQLGAILGGAGEANQKHLYEFGKNLGIAFQVQDDYLDAFGNRSAALSKLWTLRPKKLGDLLTGGFGLLKLDGFWFAVKDGALPALAADAALQHNAEACDSGRFTGRTRGVMSCGAARLQPARPRALDRGELRRHSRKPAGGRVLRSPQGLLHRGPTGP